MVLRNAFAGLDAAVQHYLAALALDAVSSLGDLAERARAIAVSGRAASVTYDLRDSADELWGLGIGCSFGVDRGAPTRADSGRQAELAATRVAA